MNAVFVLAPAALRDLRGIARYTRGQWGRKQGERYRSQLEQCFAALAEGKGRTKPLPGTLPGLFIMRCQHHFIVGRFRKDGPVTIEAVLHEKMDLVARIAERLG